MVADTQITLATDITTLQSTDVIPVGRPGNTTAYKATLTEVTTYVSANQAITAISGPLKVGVDVTTEGKITLATHKSDAPIYLYNTYATFDSYEESIIGLGYNMGGEIANHHKIFMAFETDYKYQSAPAAYAAEWYVQLNNTAGTDSVRPLFLSFDRDTLVGDLWMQATVLHFADIDGNAAFSLTDGTPPSMDILGTTILSKQTNNVKWIYQYNTTGSNISLIWLDNTNVVNISQAGYPIIGQDDFQIYNSAKGFVLADRTDGHYYRIKSTNGVLATELVA